MTHAYARCMDGHYFLLGDSPTCPLDGSAAQAAEEVLPVLGRVSGALTLATLAESGVTQDAIANVLIVELPGALPVPWLLRPWYEGEREAR